MLPEITASGHSAGPSTSTPPPASRRRAKSAAACSDLSALRERNTMRIRRV